jgi:hypothetical protein
MWWEAIRKDSEVLSGIAPVIRIFPIIGSVNPKMQAMTSIDITAV